MTGGAYFSNSHSWCQSFSLFVYPLLFKIFFYQVKPKKKIFSKTYFVNKRCCRCTTGNPQRKETKPRAQDTKKKKSHWQKQWNKREQLPSKYSLCFCVLSCIRAPIHSWSPPQHMHWSPSLNNTCVNTQCAHLYKRKVFICNQFQKKKAYSMIFVCRWTKHIVQEKREYVWERGNHQFLIWCSLDSSNIKALKHTHNIEPKAEEKLLVHLGFIIFFLLF